MEVPQHSAEDLDRVRHVASYMSTGTAAWYASQPTFCSSVNTMCSSVQGTPGSSEWHKQVMRELPLVLEGLASMVWMSVPVLLSFLCRTAWFFCYLLFCRHHNQTELFLYLVLDLMLGEVLPVVFFLYLSLHPGLQAIWTSIRTRIVQTTIGNSETRRLHSLGLRLGGADDSEICLSVTSVDVGTSTCSSSLRVGLE